MRILVVAVPGMYMLFFSRSFDNTLIPEKNGSCLKVRLNNPRGKFEIPNLADDQVDLTPEDIPGACFGEEEIGKLTVAQLKCWIKCHRINQYGNFKKRNCWKCTCTSSGFTRSISCLFSTTSLNIGLDTCFLTKFAFSGSRTCKQ